MTEKMMPIPSLESDNDEEIIETKSPEKLKEQFREVNMYRNNFEYETDSLEFPNEELFRLTKAELEIKLSEDHSLKEQYLKYVKSLRNLRQEMLKREKYKLDTESENIPLHKKNPEFLLKKVLDRVKGDRTFFNERFLSDAEVDQAAESNEDFIALIEDKMNENPNFFIQNVEQIKNLFSKETIKKIALFAAEKNPDKFLSNLSKIHELFDDSEFQEMMEDLLMFANQYTSIDLLNNKEIRSRLSQDFLQKFVENMNKDYLFNNVHELINEGLLDSAEARKTFLAYISGEQEIGGAYEMESIDQYILLFSDSRDLNKLKELIDIKINKGDFSNFKYYGVDKNIEIYTKIFGEEFKKNILQAMLDNNLSELVKYPELIISEFSKDVYLKFIDDFIENCEGLDQFEVDFLLRSNEISEDRKNKLLHRLIDISPDLAFQYKTRIMKDMSDKDKSDFMKKLMEEYPESIEYVAECMEYIIDMSEQDKRDFIMSIVNNDSYLNTIITYIKTDNNDNTKLLRELISYDEMVDILKDKILLYPQETLSRLDQITKFLGGEQEVKKFILNFSKEIPRHILYNITSFVDLLDKSEINILMQDLIKKSPEDAIDSFDSWCHIVDQELVKEFVKQAIEDNPDISLQAIRKLMNYIDESDRIEVVKKLIIKDPFIAIGYIRDLRQFIHDITEDSIINDVMEDKEAMDILPKTITSYLKKVQKAKTQDQKISILRSGFRICQSINKIKNYNLEEVLSNIKEKEKLNEKTELKVLEDLHSYAFLMENGFIASTDTKPQSSGELSNVLSDKVSEIMSQEDLSREEKLLAVEKFGGAAPILLYAFKHRNNEKIMKLFQEIYEQAGKDNYENWRFEQDRPIAELKSEGKLPQNLTPEQYQIWLQEEHSDSLESLTTSAEDLANSIRGIIFTNLNELGMKDFVDVDPRESINELQQEITEIGQALEILGKKLPRSEESDKLGIISEINILKDARCQRVKYKNILRLMILEANEIVQGYLLSGKEKKRGCKLSKFLNQLKKDDHKVSEIISKIESMISGDDSEDKIEQILETNDTANLETCFKIGSEPVQSCQDYANGDYNEALLGYVAEANTKVSIINNEKGNIIGRRIIRLMELHNGDSAIFVEQKYSSIASSILDKVMLDNIMKKAKKMGVRVYIKGEDIAPEGFYYKNTSDSLESKGGRAPYVYVDAAGGKKSLGQFKINKLKEVQYRE